MVFHLTISPYLTKSSQQLMQKRAREEAAMQQFRIPLDYPDEAVRFEFNTIYGISWGDLGSPPLG